MVIYEIYFINYWKPKYNTSLVCCDNSNLNLLNNFIWKEFTKIGVGRKPTYPKKMESSENLFFRNIPYEIKEVLYKLKNNEKAENIEYVMKFICENYVFDEYFNFYLSSKNKPYSDSNEFKCTLSLKVGKSGIYWSDTKDLYDLLGFKLKDFYSLDYGDFYNIFVKIINYYYNKDKFVIKHHRLCLAKGEFQHYIIEGILISNKEDCHKYWFN